MYGEPDVNLVSGESLVRQSVAWQRYALETFGRTSDCGWLIDSFGMSAQLPQILAKSATPYLAFSRTRVPDVSTEFRWEGIDGTTILAVNMPKLYNAGHPVPDDPTRAMKKMLKSYTFLRKLSASGEVFYPAGIDHGRPQAHGEAIRAWNDRVEQVKFQFSLPSRFFESLDAKALPTVKGEFVGELWGTYSSRSSLKQSERSCEFALLGAGKLAALAWLEGAKFPAERLRAAWRALMDCQFHDQVCGCCTDDVAAGMEERYREAAEESRLTGEEAARYIVGETEGGNLTALVFNPLSRPVRSPVELVCDLPPGWPLGVRYRARRARAGTAARRHPVRRRQPPARQGADRAGAAGHGVLGLRALSFPRRCLERTGKRPCAGPHRRHGALQRGARGQGRPRTGLITSIAAGTSRFDMGGANRLTLERELGNLYESYGMRDTWLHPMKVRRVAPAEEGRSGRRCSSKGPFQRRTSPRS